MQNYKVSKNPVDQIVGKFFCSVIRNSLLLFLHFQTQSLEFSNYQGYVLAGLFHFRGAHLSWAPSFLLHPMLKKFPVQGEKILSKNYMLCVHFSQPQKLSINLG